mgnify:CR=1 FL=1
MPKCQYCGAEFVDDDEGYYCPNCDDEETEEYDDSEFEE